MKDEKGRKEKNTVCDEFEIVSNILIKDIREKQIVESRMMWDSHPVYIFWLQR